MKNKSILLMSFILMALVQHYVPAKMIFDRENILNSGTEYKFKTMPIDPTDPFRGKYITLRYQDNTVEIENERDWRRGEPVYALLQNDNEGFATIASVRKSRPTDGEEYLKAKVSYVRGKGFNELAVEYPFDRYYMEESKADDAELAHRQSFRDPNQVTYALVNIKNGEAVIKDVLIDGISIKEVVRANKEKHRR